ncbi:MAG: FIVAR domain-containing protein [[Clostridium] spiroforme]|uniref:FIVAR domain-containing protein n=2 Tax=Thomasclavelia TaxID=3025755 RepID=A0A943EI14_9FIRM|nr:DNRLRE domain-containing protein [Thomasclavelia spiroformis]MBS5588103.1 FIVAR domain-containing protein [Thomasclavelia spiroformis]
MDDQTLIKNMMIHEANRFCNLNAVYWKTASGQELYAGDSKIEEDGWNAELLNLAAQMFPKHENADLWQYRFIEYQLAAFSIPSMTTSNEIIHGRAVKDWVYGYNVNENGTVINHGIVHPTYNAASTGVNTSLVNSLVHEKLPLAAKYNLDRLYEGLTKVDFKVEDGYKQPGGTIYRDGSYEIYCPQGNDWGGEIYDVYVNIDVSAYVYGYGDNSYNWAKLHLQKVLDQQARHEAGHTYKNSAENSYAGGEEAILMRLGCAFMTYWLAQQETVEFDNYEVNYPASDLPDLGENMQRIFASEGIYVRDGGNADTNYYPSDTIEVKKDGTGYYREGYLKYNLQDVNVLPEKAEIYVPVVGLGSNVESAKIKHVVELIDDDSWSEDTITYSNRPESSKKILLEFYPTQEGITLDVTDYVKKAYASDKEISFRIYSVVQVGGDTFVKYGSPRQADLNMRPQMLVTYGNDSKISLIGQEKVSTNQTYNLFLEGNHLHLGDNYAIEVTYDDALLKFDDLTSASENIKIESIDKTNSNKATAYISSKENTSKLINLQFIPVGKGNTNVSVCVFENGNEILKTTKDVNIYQDVLSGNFVSKKRAENISLPLDDTTVRIGEKASTNGHREEMDMKTYGNNSNTRQTFIKFPLPSDNIDEIDTVNINLNIKKLPNVTDAINVRFQYIDDNSWSEDTLNWDTKPEITKAMTGTAETIPAANQDTLADTKLTSNMVGKYVSVDITNKAKELISQGKKEISVFIYSTTYGNLSSVFSTKESVNENIRPYISTSYKKTDDLSLQLNSNQENVNRYDNMSFILSANNLADINEPIIEMNFPEFMVFDSVESLNSSIQVETVEQLNQSVRLKLSKTKDIEFSSLTDLIKLNFKTIASGNGMVSIEALDEDQQALFTEKSVVVENKTNEKLNVSLNGNDSISLNEELILTAVFNGLIPGTKYDITLENNANILNIEKLYATNQNLIVKEESPNHFTLIALKSQEPYELQINVKNLQEFINQQSITLILNDESNVIEKSHELSFNGIVDKTILKIALDLANAITDKDLANVVPVVEEFKQARDKANKVYNDASASQDKVDAAFDRLASIMQKLEFFKGDKTALKAFIDKVSGLEAAKYTEATWTPFNDALKEATDVYNDENAMQEEVNNAYNELVTAFLNLRLIPDKSLLEDLINQANGLNSANYTKATFDGLTKALNEAKAVFDNPNASQVEVDNAKDVLAKAMANLQTVKAPVNNGDTTVSVKTGDESLVGMFAGIALLSVAGYALLRRKED